MLPAHRCTDNGTDHIPNRLPDVQPNNDVANNKPVSTAHVPPHPLADPVADLDPIALTNPVADQLADSAADLISNAEPHAKPDLDPNAVTDAGPDAFANAIPNTIPRHNPTDLVSDSLTA